MVNIRVISLMLLIVCLVSLVGCSSGHESTVTANGILSVRGKPLSGAVITLEPMSGTTGPNASVPVFGGKFSVPATADLHGGTYRVRVAMIPRELCKGLPAEQAALLPPADTMIDPAFDANSQLVCELKPDHSNSLKFEVEFL
ncbi:hypothetical protein [Rubripirellula reticaptiva]|uniref:Carboxypeptidase regulatory-like domain-containing protein n=1 Tax=Rubripirellula reticaptiva TaxID=2528013 RepID=A0A5C6EH18_9BACT|nr:hypothetical protein [Rubripirellula reticaptiva]TWU47774.1 hypothetical protein Poly59_46150 [Rubripirellula reticaptiva]